MGTLRLILALSVVYGHAGDFLGFPLIPGDTAVQAFYAISGFYMALVLNEKYRPETTGYFLFMSNRFWRLFPVYATVLVLTLLLALAVSKLSSSELPFVAQWRSLGDLNWWSAAFLVGSQILMWGQDLYFILTLEGGALAFWPDFHTSPRPLFPLLAIPQGWTLGLELSFYLIAPFIVRRSAAAIAAVLAVSLALRIFLQLGLGYHGDPWSYRFFPSEVAVFLVGALGYLVYRSRPGAEHRSAIGIFALAVVSVGACLLVNRWSGLGRIASVAFLMAAFAAIPFLFRLTNRNAFDRHLGELSYPVYICHFLVIFGLDRVAAPGALVRGITVVVLTTALAGALYWWIDRPVDGWRQRRFVARRAHHPAAAPEERRPGLAPSHGRH